MKNALELFPPSKEAASARLHAFVSKAGQEYARNRNFDLGPDQHQSVSLLSPYLKLKLLDERTVVRAVLAKHDEKSADKFLAEVFWRTYWKGWMELRPSVWDHYVNDVNQLRNEIQTQAGLRAQWESACFGQTGIAPFDHWAEELVQTGYLHNHARMWFASIWIFTLKLPWQLGADFFLRHLLDGDAAVNTLSWRWVAGIQSVGKTYLADPDNIAKFTLGRFASINNLAQTAHPIPATPAPNPEILPPSPPLPLSQSYGLLVHTDDLDVDRLERFAATPRAHAVLVADAEHSPWHMSQNVESFRSQAAKSVAQERRLDVLKNAQELAEWGSKNGLEQIVAPYAPVGPTRSVIEVYRTMNHVVPLSQYRRPLDEFAWPLATKGFFPFRKHIPRLVERFVRD